ncbi:MAG: hypothetical protein IPP07_31605 [Holophagales bacterium]|nr:hypothetical protein [Holophagales bacterium]MBK9969123.1 hypothetical protein [Holophagales bacterium]
MADKSLGAAWQVFRFTLRDTAAEYAKAHMTRIASLPLEPTDPDRVAPFVSAVLAELDRSSVADEASPVLRAMQKTFRPTREQKYRRRLAKAFDAYGSAWRARPAS